MAVIETAGATSLDLDGSNRYVLAGSVFLRYGGSLVAPGQFGTWSPIGAEAIGTGYTVVWKRGSNEYVVWKVDSGGNFLSQSALLTGTSVELRSLEPGFNQDLNSNGINDAPSVIDSAGATTLSTIAGVYVLSPSGSSLGPQLRYGGSVVTTGQFGGWAAIGAELIGSNYQVVWQNGASYIIWNVDANGNWLSQSAVLSSSSAQLRSLETGFNQDLNGNAAIESASVLDSAGSTRLSNIAGAYVLSPSGSSLGQQLKYGGALVAAGQFGGWTPIGAEASGSGYQVVWKNGTSYIIWAVDGSGNWLSQSAVLGASSAELRSLEPGFNQDLNSSGGIETRTSIDAVGSTLLASVANAYVLSPSGSSIGPQLKFGGSLVAPGQFGGWTPIGAEAYGSGYLVVWRNGTSYITWNVDGNGNWLSQGAVMASTSADLRALEPYFNQDLNSSGGVDTRTTVEATGSTTLGNIANFYTLSAAGSSFNQVLKYGGAAFTSGQFASWTPVAAELSGGMYRVVFKNGSANQYIAWNVDTAGNYVSQGAAVMGTTWWAQSYENVVQFDFNGDGLVGPTTSAIESTGGTSLTQVADSYFFNYGSSNIQVRQFGTYVAVNQFGAWTPKAVEVSGGMYRLAWKNGSADEYVAWNIDASGNYVSQGATVSGSTWWLQSYEPVVQNDLNGDGTVGAIVTSIESSGMTSLTRQADSYFINNSVQVLYGGSYAGSSQFLNWTAVGAEQTVGCYLVAWRNSASGNYTVWNLDGSGNYVWNSAEYGASSSLFFALEATFQQDFNGGGISGRSTVEGSGTTALYNASGYLQMVRGPYTGPLLSIGANYVTAGQYGTAMGAEWNGGGYVVAWKTGTDTYNFWNTDGSGRYSTQTGNLAGSSAQMQNYEYTFNQDLNADGVIGINNTPFDIQIVFSGSSQYQTYFEQAAQRWERIIRGDLSAVNSATYGFIDDLRIDASVQFIDGTNGILAQAGWDLRRSSSEGGLPYHGIMRFDSADITSMVNNGTFLSVVMHEMGHVLGIGTLWDTFGLRSGSSYLGANANARYRELGGSGFVPLETTGGSGTAFAHWSEARFDRELMTGYSESSAPMPLSTITVGGLQDLGYVVDYGQADSYSLGGLMAPESYVDDSGMGGLGAVGSILAHDATGGGDTLTFNDVSDQLPVIDDTNMGGLSAVGICQCGCMGSVSATALAGLSNYSLAADGTVGSSNGAADAGLGDVSLMTTYLANSFVTSGGESGVVDATASSSAQDFLTRPLA